MADVVAEIEETKVIEDPPVVHLLSGAAAGMIAELSTHPMDTIRTRLQHQRGEVNLNTHFIFVGF